jgi:hypothetical protein
LDVAGRIAWNFGESRIAYIFDCRSLVRCPTQNGGDAARREAGEEIELHFL